MPVEARCPAVPVTLQQRADHVLVEWEWQGDVYQRRYHWPTENEKPGDDWTAYRQAAITKANAFAGSLRELHLLPNGPSIFKLTEDDLQERERDAENVRLLLEQYVSCFIDHTDASEIAAQLNIRQYQIGEDAKLVGQYIRCRAQHERLGDARKALAAFLDGLTEDEKADLHVVPSLREKLERFRHEVEACRAARRGMLDCKRRRPELFEPSDADIRLRGELVAA